MEVELWDLKVLNPPALYFFLKIEPFGLIFTLFFFLIFIVAKNRTVLDFRFLKQKRKFRQNKNNNVPF